MLPTEKASLICLNTNEQLYLSKEMNMADDNNEYQHLYIISDEKCKDGEWCTDGIRIAQVNCLTVDDPNAHLYSKIVATTDKLILTNMKDSNAVRDIDFDIEVPQIPESFIQAYIKAYNEDKPITEVDLEIETAVIVISKNPLQAEGIKTRIFEIKTRPDNTVIIHQSKLYTRDEVEYLIKCATDEILHVLGYDTGKKMKETGVMSHINKWIQDNL